MSRKPKPKGSLLAALDIGSAKIACFIARVIDDEGNFEVLGVGHQASKGIKSGGVTNMEEAEASIRSAVHAAEHMAAEIMKGYPLREVIVNLAGVHAGSRNQHVIVDIAGHDVTENDISCSLAKAQEEVLGAEEEIVHTIPVSYSIDAQNGIRDPLGMSGQKMGVEAHMLVADKVVLGNMASCIERSHLDISAFCVAPYAAGLASLVEDEMDLGCTVIDMGAGVTSFAVFQGGSIAYCGAIPIGGHHVTNDIAAGLTTSLANAERIKALYGCALAAATDHNEMIDVPRLGEEEYGEPNHVPRSLLVGIIQPRLEEIFELVRARLNDSPCAQSAGKRVVLTGGASQLADMRDLAQHVLDKQVRLGRPIHLTGLPDSVSGPAFATTAGLLSYISERSHEMPADIAMQADTGSVWHKVTRWIKDNW